MSKHMKSRLGVLALSLVVSLSAHAHRTWMLPSATVFSSQSDWITVDAAAGDSIFYFDHAPLKLDTLQIIAPDGTQLKPENSSTGKYRSSFDAQLTQSGTYRFSLLSPALFASYQVNGETRRWRGVAANLAKEIPANASALEVTEALNRIDVFASVGKPSSKVLTASGKGLEFVPVTHPNDLVAGERAQFGFQLDGKPAAGLEVSIIPAGIRYRDKLNDMHVTTDKNGQFSVIWPAAGMYFLETEIRDQQAQAPATQRRLSYNLTLEVLAP